MSTNQDQSQIPLQAGGETARRSKVLLADTDEHTRADLLRKLHGWSGDVATVDGAAAIVQQVDANLHCGCIILARYDLFRQQSRRLARRLRAFPRGSNYLIFLLDDREPGTIVRAFDAGAQDVMIRPLEERALRARLEHVRRFLELERWREQVRTNGALMAEMSSTTIVHGRNYFENELRRELERSRRYEHSLALALLRLEVPYGSAEGAFRAIGRRLANHVRTDIDWVARYERSEFAVVFPETGLRNACATARRLGRALETTDLEEYGVPGRGRWQFGVSAFDRLRPIDNASAEQLIAAARHYLAEARRNGPHALAAGPAPLAARSS